MGYENGAGRLNRAGAALVVFILGFMSGREYAISTRPAGPLSFADRSADCTELFRPDASIPAVREVSATADPAPGANSAAVGQAQAFAASKNSTLYHNKDCPFVKRIKPGNLVWYASAEKAREAGKQPHACAGK